MRNRFLTVSGALLIAVITLPGADGPRTPEGRPDLSGIYDIATLTPLVRPANVGDRRFYWTLGRGYPRGGHHEL